MLPKILRDSAVRDESLRSGLPLDLLDRAGTGRNVLDPTQPLTCPKLWAHVKDVLDSTIASAAPIHLAEAADALGSDYFANRMPPVESIREAMGGKGERESHISPPTPSLDRPTPSIGRGIRPEKGCALRLCPPEFRRIVYPNPTSKEGDNGEDGERFVVLQHCMGNEIGNHLRRPRGEAAEAICGDTRRSCLGFDERTAELSQDNWDCLDEDVEVGFVDDYKTSSCGGLPGEGGGGVGVGVEDSEDDGSASRDEEDEDDEEEEEHQDYDYATSPFPQFLNIPKNEATLGALLSLTSAYPQWLDYSELSPGNARNSTRTKMIKSLLDLCWQEGVLETAPAAESRAKKLKTGQGSTRQGGGKKGEGAGKNGKWTAKKSCRR